MKLGSDHWTVWFDRHAAALVLFAQQIVGQRADAEDAVQEAFVRFWRQRQHAKDPLAYLYTCVRRCALDHLRGKKRRQHREQRAASSRVEACLAESGQSSDRRLLIERAMGALPDTQRQVVVMKIWGELTFAQIAGALDISPNTAASRFRYALERMREQIDEATIP